MPLCYSLHHFPIEIRSKRDSFEEVIGFSHCYSNYVSVSQTCTLKCLEGHFSKRFLAEGRRDD